MPSTARAPASFKLRDATLADLDALMALEVACYPPGAAFTPREYEYALARAKAVNLAAERRGRLVAFGGAFYHAGWRAGHVFTLNVHPDARRRGLGRAILEALEARLARAGGVRVALEVNVANEDAIRLYERLGYERIGRLANYYAVGKERDAFVYEKSLEV